MRIPFLCSRHTSALALLLVLGSTFRSLDAAPPSEHEQILSRAREILANAPLGESERNVRLQVLKAVLTGTVIRPDDDYPEMRNPKHWVLTESGFVVKPKSSPVEAISDLWVVHENDGVPIPRIRCYKYSSLILIQGYIQYFRESGSQSGLAALDRLLGHRVIPDDLPNGGDDLLWKRDYRNDPLLPGDQVWFDNPFYEPGRELMRQEAFEQGLREGKSESEAKAAAEALTDAKTAGEEGSNVFYLGDGRFSRGGASVSRLCRNSFQPANGESQLHEQVFTPMIFTFGRFQEHMIDDNYTAQACLRKDPASVRPEHFPIYSVRSPLDPESLSKRCDALQPDLRLEELIDAMASRNKPPKLEPAGDAAVPLFPVDFHWPEQQRVRQAIEAVRRIQSDELWWRLRASVGDTRYALTASRGKDVRNFTVGELCSDIIDTRLCLGFTAHLPSVPGRLPASFRPEQEFWQREAEWEQARAPLYLMQAALCERAIRDWESVRGTLPGSDGLAHPYSADEKARCLAALKKEIVERVSSKKARYEEVVVPLLPAPGGWEGYDALRAKEAREEQGKGLAASSR